MDHREFSETGKVANSRSAGDPKLLLSGHISLLLVSCIISKI